jgi:demethylmenaquinone methyltransferase/2-methoxy-6-polyprenyl-1,4-benzoquinol methylase
LAIGDPPARAPSNGLAPHPVLERYYERRSDRPGFVQSLFDRSARDYDRIDAITSLGTGSWYRRRMLVEAGLAPGMRVLDVGCGTGLVAREAATIVGETGEVVGVDPSPGMRARASMLGRFDVMEGVAEWLPVGDGRFDLVTMGYALRHVEDLGVAFAEFRRVLAPGGRVLLLELTPPKSPAGRVLMRFVMRWLVPSVSSLVTMSRDAWRMMRYFWETIDRCVPPDRVVRALKATGFTGVRRSVELGVFSMYTGTTDTQANCMDDEARIDPEDGA